MIDNVSTTIVVRFDKEQTADRSSMIARCVDRIRYTWMVLIGKADVLVWPDKNKIWLPSEEDFPCNKEDVFILSPDTSGKDVWWVYGDRKGKV